MILNAEISNIAEWKAVLNAIDGIVEEAMFICNNEGITFRGMDPNHIALLDITFPKSSFKRLETTPTFFGVRTNEIKNIFSSASDDDILELQIKDGISLTVLINGSLSMSFTLRLIEKTETNIPVPKVTENSKISVSPVVLTRIITNIERVSEYITIKSLSNKVEFSGKGEIGDAKINLLKSDTDLIELHSENETAAVYSLEYMAKVIRSIGRASKNVDMKYGESSPLLIEFEMPSKTKVGYYLAPRIED
tara:strand:+ start:297 stop:1046 length:750 start_codon:yes stop_codon:yes gene_type:complete